MTYIAIFWANFLFLSYTNNMFVLYIENNYKTFKKI